MTVKLDTGSTKAKTIGELLALGPQQGGDVTLSLSLAPGEEPAEGVVKRLMRSTASSGVDIVQVHPLSRVVSVRGAPGALVPLIESSEIRDALYSNQSDVLPKPVRRRVVDLDTDAGFVPVPARSGPAPRRKGSMRTAPMRRK